MPPQHLDTMMYIDDSGHPQSGSVVYGWVSFSPDRWSDVLGSWMNNRKNLYRTYGLPIAQELHMTDYVLGRGRISLKPPEEFVHDGRIFWKDLGGAVALECLRTLSSTEGISIGSVYYQGAPDELALNRQRVYQWLIQRKDRELKATHSLGLVYMDGDGSDTSYRDIHRRLPRAGRNIVEDPIFLDSRTSQFMQMADHVAWCANASIAKIPKHSFAHGWYEDYLAVRDTAREPIILSASDLVGL